MAVSITLAALALRAGLRLRRARLAGVRRPPEWRRRHLALAKPAVVMALIGFVAGPISAFSLRDWSVFSSFHGLLGLLVAGLFAATGLLGRQLERGRSHALDAHALLAALSVLGAAVAAVAGFVLLP
jgi:hypothetical protein